MKKGRKKNNKTQKNQPGWFFFNKTYFFANPALQQGLLSLTMSNLCWFDHLTVLVLVILKDECCAQLGPRGI